MPELTIEDVKAWSLARVLTEMKTRLEDVQAIKDRSDDNALASAEGEDADKAGILLRDLNTIGVRHDEVQTLAGADDKTARLADWLNKPEGDPPPIATKDKNTKTEFKLAARFIEEDDGYKAAKEGGSRNFTVEVPVASMLSYYAKVLGTDDALAGVDDEFPPQSIRLPGIQVPVLFQESNIAQMFLQGTTTQNAVLFMRETVTSEGAVETLEGGTKPEADISFTEDSAPVENIAVTLPVTAQLLEDVGFMRSWVGGRLRLFVLNREDLQLISGDGVAPNIEGVLTVAGTGAQSYSIAAAVLDATVAFDALYNSVTDVRQAFLPPSGIAMAAGTWERFRLGKDANNQYLMGPVNDEAAPRIWGLPVTLNERMPAEAAANEPIFVAAREAAQVLRRNTLTLAVTDSHASEFTSNVLRFRAELRTSFPIYRPAGISVVTSAT